MALMPDQQQYYDRGKKLWDNIDPDRRNQEFKKTLEQDLKSLNSRYKLAYILGATKGLEESGGSSPANVKFAKGWAEKLEIVMEKERKINKDKGKKEQLKIGPSEKAKDVWTVAPQAKKDEESIEHILLKYPEGTAMRKSIIKLFAIRGRVVDGKEPGNSAILAADSEKISEFAQNEAKKVKEAKPDVKKEDKQKKAA